MRAITQYRYGSPDVLRSAELPRPVVGDGQILVRVRAAGLDRRTQHLLTGKPYAVRLATGMRRPTNPVPGRDVAGIVAEVGTDVVGFAPGDEVYGVAPGSFAEYAVTTPDELSRKPVDLSFARAAVVPISAAPPSKPSKRVDSGPGYVHAIGAHRVLTHPHDDWADGTRRWDVIIDIAGNPTIRRLRQALTPHGTASFVGGEDAGVILGMGRQIRGALLSRFIGQRLVPLLARERAEHCERLTDLIEAGQLDSTDVAVSLEARSAFVGSVLRRTARYHSGLG